MHLSKSTVLPIMGMVVLAVFIIISYIHGSIFLNQIVVCSLILSVVFIAKIRDGVHQTMANPENRTNNRLSK
jgi:hypothetical protein